MTHVSSLGLDENWTASSNFLVSVGQDSTATNDSSDSVGLRVELSYEKEGKSNDRR